MPIKLQIRRGTASAWSSASPAPVLLSGEVGYETDTGNFKVGDGTTAWGSLAYVLSTLPQTTVSGTDMDAAGFRSQGRYEIGVAVTSNVPTDWTPASDAPGILLVTRIATGSIAQVLFSTKTQKVFCRGWDGSNYTTWISLSNHADTVNTAQIVNLAVTTGKIADDAVTFAKMQNSAAAGLSVVGRSTNSAGDFSELNAANDGEVVRRSGTSVGFGTVAAAGLATDSVTTAKIAASSVTSAKMGTQVVQKSQVFTASGTWTSPATAGGVFITVVGGGGGGGQNGSGNGGHGGRIHGYLSVTPNTVYAVTIGTGGAGSNTTNAFNGGASDFLGVTATGGAGGTGTGGNGADGVGSPGTQPSGVTLHSSYIPVSLGGQFEDRWKAPSWRPNAAGSTAAIAFSVTGTLSAGSGGTMESAAAGNNATGGVNGMVEVSWFEFT